LVNQMSERVPKSPEERLDETRELIGELGTVRIDRLAANFGVSEMTVRRDLDELEALGLARRVRGGAIALGPEPWEQRHRHNARAKARIAEKLLPMVPTSGTIALDASTTIYRLAASIQTVRDLVVVTNGWDTFRSMKDTPGVTASITGGVEEPRTGSLVGPAAIRAAQAFLYDVFFSSAAALDSDLGTSEAAVTESEVKRAFSRTSSQIVVAVDHGKLGTRAPARVFDFEQIDVLVTDLEPTDSRLDVYRDLVQLV
jgi:DeoR family fructose operon transcriptional repressor